MIRRITNRTYSAIHNQMNEWRKLNDIGMSGLAAELYGYLHRHGPMTSAQLSELTGSKLSTISIIARYLVSRSAIVAKGAYPPYVWHINNQQEQPSLSSVVNENLQQRRANHEIGITDADREWMRRYQEQRERRLARIKDMR